MTTATARREAARGNGVASAGQFGYQAHSAPGTFLPVDHVKVMAAQVESYNEARVRLMATGEVYASEQLRALFPTATEAYVTFADRYGLRDELLDDDGGDTLRVTKYEIYDEDQVDLVAKFDTDIEQIQNAAAEAERPLTAAERSRISTLEADRARLREHAEIAFGALSHKVLTDDFSRQYRVGVPKTEVPAARAKTTHFAAMDRARAEAHATIDLFRRDLAAYAEEFRFDEVAHVEIHTRAADAFDEESENIAVNRIFDRDGEVIYDFARGADREAIDEFAGYAEEALSELNAKTDDANLRLMSKLARDAATYGIDPQDTSKGLPASTGTFGKMPLWDPSADPTSVTLFDA